MQPAAKRAWSRSQRVMRAAPRRHLQLRQPTLQVQLPAYRVLSSEPGDVLGSPRQLSRPCAVACPPMRGTCSFSCWHGVTASPH